MAGYYLYTWAPFLIVAVIICFIGYRAYTRRVQEKEKLKKIALEFGFTFTNEGSKESTETGAPLTDSNGVRGFLNTISGWQMSGRVNGVDTKIYSKQISSGSNRRHEYTCIDCLAKWNSNSSLMITREGSLSRFGKAIFDMQDIRSGNEELDRRVMIKGVPERFIERILKDATLQQELLALFEIEGGIYVDQKGSHFQTPGTLIDQQRFRQLLERMSRTASALERASA